MRAPTLRRVGWAAPPLAALLILLVYPMLQVVATSFDAVGSGAPGQAWPTVLGDPAVHRALLTTLQVAAMTTLGCLVLGVFLALVLAYVPFPGAGAVTRLVEAVISFPSFLIPLAFGTLFGPVGIVNTAITGTTGAAEGPLQFMGSVHGVVLAEVAYFTPFIVRPVLAAFQRLPPDQINAASSLGAHPGRIVGQVILPGAYPAIAGAGVLVFMLALNEFGIILFTGAQDVVTLPLMVYTRAIVTFDLPGASVIACLQAAVSLLVYFAYSRLFVRRSGR
ncbi:2-aminoethylphosphonate ABC transporter permease subunit [Rothia halotolerans]|uniref:2-aminoethylphosphonate ABC transporter permease subunit n=1 Tax=Rothia halotolerans TaxID=405770 RepID=UPI00101DD94B|nr:2-aminoethylphosphonate ABC transporter permease subunit [Rothia halotolerans]